MWKQYNKDWPFPWKIKQLCWSCSSSVWKENNLNLLSRKFQFSCRYLQVVPDCWGGQQVGNPSCEHLTKKSDLNWNIRYREGGNPHFIRAGIGLVLLSLRFLEKSDFCNCANFKLSWCIKNIFDKAELKTILLTLSAWCLSSAVCVCHLLPAWAPCCRQMVSRVSFQPVWGNKRVMV